jgi:SpoVK/Ycf46/Vps4 family AAA+-type ATPase
MSVPWRRAIRSTARCVPKTPIANRSDRSFHASIPGRTAAATPTGDKSDAANPPGNGRSKPDKDDETQSVTKEEKLFGDEGLTANREDSGRRQRRFNGTSRSRTMRSRTPDELPPIQLPDDFQQKHVCRHEALRKSPLPGESGLSHSPGGSASPTDVGTPQEPAKPGPARFLRDPLLRIFDAAAWNDADVLRACADIRAGRLAHIAQRGDVAVLAASLKVSSVVSDLHGSDPLVAVAKQVITKVKQQLDQDSSAAVSRFEDMFSLAASWKEARFDYSEQDLRLVLRRVLHDPNLHAETKALGPLHYEILHEAMASIRADLAVEPPKSIKAADLRRPITVLDFPYFSGFKWPKYIVEHMAREMGADVLHLTAQDIARYVGSYLGEDVTRAPGPLSLLGYKAAENSGRIHRPKPRDEDDEQSALKLPLSIVLGTDKSKKEMKRGVSLSQFLLGESGGRGKSDEMWQDLKMNSALEELIQISDCEASQKNPLIVHIHDFNAINMSLESGPMIINKLRKIVDGMWCDGRRVVLIGTCSSLESPDMYLKGIEEFEGTERLLTLHAADPTGAESLQKLQKEEFLEENTTNIQSMLETLLRPSSDGNLPAMDFSLLRIRPDDRPEVFSDQISPLSEVYRIAKTMIGLRGQQPGTFDQSLLEEAIQMMRRIDHAKERFAKDKETVGRQPGPPDEMVANMRKLDPRFENHEDKLMSGLVNSKDIRTTFSDVHAPLETIESVKMLTQLSLVRPEAFSYGVLATDRIPGCLLYGPPGTGKTLLAKAVAKESGANMIEISGASINNMFVGESEKNVKALFTLAKKKEPLVIFIDEADAMLGSRGRRNVSTRRETINQFLREWDGMDNMKAFIMVATNRPFDLDEAVLRRLPRKLLIDLPLEQDRAAILRIHLKGESVDDSVSIDKLAKDTPMYSGSDLKNVCVAAAMAAVKEEVEASERHAGPDPYVWAEKRILSRRHFDKAVAEISASVNEDMESLTAIRKFDERYGDSSAKRKKRRGIGFQVAPEAIDSNQARVRK